MAKDGRFKEAFSSYEKAFAKALGKENKGMAYAESFRVLRVEQLT